MSLGPFDLAGGPFLTLYGALLVVTVIAGLAIPRWLRPEGRSLGTAEPDQLAFLAGGADRFADAVVAGLLAVRALVLGARQRFEVVARDAGRTPAERSVLALPSPIGWGDMHRTLKREADPIQRRLVESELLMTDGTAWQLRFWQTTPYLLLLMFGTIKWEVGTMRDRPIGFLTVFLVVTAVFALFRFLALDPRTRGGIAVVNEARTRADRIRRAPTAADAGMAVALFGTVVLAGSAWGDFHRMRQSSGGDGGSSSDSGGDGGGGGGGCGGCGS